MKLVDVYTTGAAKQVLFDLLKNRPLEANISHLKMPSIEEHCDFVDSRPYEAWYLIEEEQNFVGAVYLTQNNEVGVSIFRKYQGNGHAAKAIRLLRERHPRDRYLANINPDNGRSIRFFEKLGFRHVQNTYALDV